MCIRDRFKSQFIATYPATVTLAANDKYEFSKLPTLNDQDQLTLDGQDVTKKIMMISHTTAVKENSYDAVGEKIDLNFIRPFTAVVFRTSGIDEEYANIFGKLKSITLTAKGYDADNNGSSTDPEAVSYTHLIPHILKINFRESQTFFTSSNRLISCS